MITRREWWIGVILIVGALVFHAVWSRQESAQVAQPRYEYLPTGDDKPLPFTPGQWWMRVDNWTGKAELVFVTGPPMPSP